MRILVVEDDPAVSHSLALMLRSETCSIHTTDLGEEGVDLAKLNAYDIMFLDLNLPDLSGYEVLHTGSGRWTRIEDSWVVEQRVGWCAMRRGGEPWRGLLIF